MVYVLRREFAHAHPRGLDHDAPHVNSLSKIHLISILHIIIAVCSPVCQNSGTCTSPNVCACTSGYTGAYCQTGEYEDDFHCSKSFTCYHEDHLFELKVVRICEKESKSTYRHVVCSLFC